jgi:hypothetical protein
MPTASGPALVDAFQSGMGNVLLSPLGQGVEARGLLDRMLPHQAVFVVEAAPWAARLALSLHDFSDELHRGRMHLFVGDGAWEGLTEFLIGRRGFLVPERILAWPWFDRARIQVLTERLTRLGSDVATSRTGLHSSQHTDADRPAETAQSLVIVSNVSSSSVRSVATELCLAAAALGLAAERFVLDDPAMVHPSAIEEAIHSMNPAGMILLDTVPAALPYAAPRIPAAILCMHIEPLDEKWLEGASADALLCVKTCEQAAQAAARGWPADRVVRVAPACSVRWIQRGPVPAGRRIGLSGDTQETEARTVGLHLGSHQQLWRAAVEIIQRAPDGYFDHCAGDVLSAAAGRLGYELRSDPVRRGLVERIRRRLGPTLVRQACAGALRKAGIEFIDDPWSWQSGSVGVGASCDGRPFEAAGDGELPGLFVFADPSGRVQEELLERVAAGIPVAVRAHPRDADVEGLASILDADAHVTRFSTAAELVDLVRRFQADPAPFIAKAREARRVVLERHTWAQRLKAIDLALRHTDAARL